MLSSSIRTFFLAIINKTLKGRLLALIVTKFGGTSVASPERIGAVADRLIALKEEGNQVLSVVSAMGKETDRLLELAYQISEHPSSRELDMLLTTGEQVSISLLAMAIQQRGHKAISFTGPQVGIITDSTHSKAKITAVSAEVVRDALREGNIVIVAGFQGRTQDGQITTLGRGGSDTTAVALAAGLGADRCDIFTDVDGVYTADPRIVSQAQKIDSISYEEMLELAACGAGVLSMRSVEFARNYDVVLTCRSSFNTHEGTIIKKAGPSMEQAIVSGIAYDASEVKFTLRGLEDRPGIAATLFGALADYNVNVDMILQNVSEKGITDLSFTAPETDLERTKEALDSVKDVLDARDIVIDENIAKISLVGAGMKTSPGVTAKTFAVLGELGINIQLISTSPIRISCIIELGRLDEALKGLHTAFGLDADDTTDEAASAGEES